MSFPARWGSIQPLLTRSGPFAQQGFEGDPENLDQVQNSRILVVGAGGLGCEILKDLAMSGFQDIHVIDLDTIDVSNLNRQFLFRMKDVHKPKAQVAADFVMKRCPGVQVKWYSTPIQEFAKSWYKKFDLVVAGLDNIAARSWLNETLVDLVKFDEDGEIDWDTCIPLVDGGTEGFNGQSRLFLARHTSCFECSLVSMAEQVTFPECTIRNVPRIPEHCISYALKVSWRMLQEFKKADEFKLYEPTGEDDQHKPDAVVLDKDNVEHMSWIFHSAGARAKKFGITGVTFDLTMQVVKNIIPAIASTNALISAACANEAFKYLSGTSQRLNNYMMYMGGKGGGIHADVFKYKRNPECKVCHDLIMCENLDPMMKFSDFVTQLQGRDTHFFRTTADENGKRTVGPLGELKSLANQQTNAPLLLKNPEGKVVMGAENMDKSLGEVINDKELLSATAKNIVDDVQKIYVSFKQ